MVDEMKEGIMEDDKKGTWADVTEECAVDDTGHCGFVTVKHNEITVGWLGHRVEGSKFQKNYRMTSNLDSNDGRYGDCGAFKVEHFIPDPEWVDVTEECTLRFGYTKNHVVVVHDSVAVLSLGDKAYEERDNNAAHGYRVIFEKNDFQGYFKVEKRNG